MERRQFLYLIGVGSLATVALSACGSSGGSGNNGANGAASVGGGGSGVGVCAHGTNVTYANPTHAHTTVALAQAQVIAGTPGDYMLLSGNHSHTFILTAEDFIKLQNGQTLMNVPETDSLDHGHLVDIVCG